MKDTQSEFDPQSFLAKVGEGRTIETYAAGQTVFRQGDAANSVFYLQDGEVRLAVVSVQGKEGVIALLTEPAFFGEGCLAGQTERRVTATTMTKSIVARLQKSAILRVLHDEPAFSELFITHLLERAIRAEADLVDQLFNSSEKRLARALLLLADFGKQDRHESLLENINQNTLAQMIGTTRARVNVFMNKFRDRGYIDYNGHITVNDSLLNVLLHTEPR